MTNMTTGMLIKYLKTLPSDTPIMIASDSEGNNYSPLDSQLSIGGIVRANRELTEIVFDQENEDDEYSVGALVIYPTI